MKKQSSKDKIFLTCDELLELGNEAEEITYQMVVDRMGFKGKTENTYNAIREWKSLKSTEAGLATSNQDTLQLLLGNVSNEINQRVEKQVALTEEKFRTTIDDLNETLSETLKELSELKEFKANFSNILEAANAKVEKHTKENTDILCELYEERALRLKSEETNAELIKQINTLKEEANQQIDKYMTFIDAQAKLRAKEVDEFEHRVEVARAETTAIQIRLERTEEQLTLSKIKAADLHTLNEEATRAAQTAQEQLKHHLDRENAILQDMTAVKNASNELKAALEKLSHSHDSESQYIRAIELHVNKTANTANLNNAILEQLSESINELKHAAISKHDQDSKNE